MVKEENIIKRVDDILLFEKLVKDYFLLADELKTVIGDIEKGEEELKTYADVKDITADEVGIMRKDIKTFDELLSEFNRLEINIGNKEASLKEFNEKVMLEGKAKEFLGFVLDGVLGEYIGKLEKTVNDVFSYVYEDDERRILLSLEDFREKKVLKLKLERLVDDAWYEEKLDKGGFSVKVVIGSVLLIYYILYNNLEKVIFFDESFSGLSDETIKRFFDFLGVFIRDYGFKFVVITHDKRVKSLDIDNGYEVVRGKFIASKRD